MEEKFTVQKLKEDVLFDFLLKKTFQSISWWSSLVLVIVVAIAGAVMCSIGKLDWSYYFIVLIAAVALLGSIPFQTKVDAKRQAVNNSSYTKPMTYRFHKDTGISIQQGKEKSVFEWGQITKVMESKKAIGFFCGRSRILIIPKENYAKHAQAIGKMMTDNLDAKVIRLKQV